MGYSPWGLQESDTTKHVHRSTKEAPASDRDRINVLLPVKNAQTTAELYSSHMLVSNAQNYPSQASVIHEP